MGLALLAVDLADHSGQHLFFCGENLVVAGGGFSRRRLYRRTIRSHVRVDGNCFSGGAALAGLHRMEISGAAILAAGAIIRTAILKLEIIWTALTAVLFIGLNLMGSSVWASAAL